MGKKQKLERKMSLLAAFLRNERNITKHHLVQFGQTDTSLEAVTAKLLELQRIYDRQKTGSGKLPDM